MWRRGQDGKFQFLIGRLKTRALTAEGKTLYTFQFLIGRLKTEAAGMADLREHAFQFLIGRLKTMRW